MSDVPAVPPGFHTVTPYLVVTDAERQIQFLCAAFDGIEEHRTADASGRIMHAQVRVGDSAIMLGEGNEKWPPLTAAVHLYVEDCDRLYRQALAAGGASLMEPSDQFYGDRSGGVKDPNGNFWWISTHVEDVSEVELARRMRQQSSR